MCNGSRIFSILSFLLLLSFQLTAQSSTAILPGPEPFSLDAESAVYCIDLLERNRFIEIKSSEGHSDVVKVETVWSLFLGEDESFYEGHRRRYDIIVNGGPLDWDNSFVEYGSEMLNLRLLFLYRNQHPPGGLEYRSSY